MAAALENPVFKHPIAQLLKAVQKPILQDSVTRLVLQKISEVELNKLLDWEGLSTKEINQILNDPNLNRYESLDLMVALYFSSMTEAFIARQELARTYPDRKIDYNNEFKPSQSDWNFTRNWLTIAGQNAKIFDDAHGGIGVENINFALKEARAPFVDTL